MEFIGLFKCNFCPSNLHDIESLITHFSIQHLNTELFECEACCVKFWKIPDYYEHRNNSNSTCGGKYGITMRTFFNTIKSFFENSPKIEDVALENCFQPSSNPNSVKSEIFNDDDSPDINFTEKPSKTFDSLNYIEKSEEIPEEAKIGKCLDNSSHSEIENCNSQERCDNVSSSSSLSEEPYRSKLRNLRAPKKSSKKLLQRKSKRKKPRKSNEIKIEKKKDTTEKVENQNCNGIEDETNKNCKICGKCFENLENLRIHLKNHGNANENEVHICHVCNKEFNFLRSLNVHISLKHPENLCCTKCSKHFNDQESYRTHINEFHKIKRNRKKKETKKLECFECTGKVFTRISTFVMHLSNKHKKSDEEVKQILEVNNEIFKNELLCKICGKLFATIDHLMKHQKKKHGDDGSKKHKCKSCPKFFATQDEVTVHTLEYHKEKLVCQICNTGKVYSCTESLTGHIRKIHSTNVIEQNNSDDSNAMKRCTKQKVYKFICGQCGKIMYGRTQFKNHEASNCGKNPVHKCHICGKGFASAGTLKGHISIHENYESYPFVCDFCQKRYRSKHQLEKHRRVHTGERPFQCPHCEKAFGTSAALFVHISTHTGIKRYMCTCGERFSCITGLKGHWKTNATTCGSDPNRSTKPVGEYIGYRKGKIVNIRPEDEMMMRPSL